MNTPRTLATLTLAAGLVVIPAAPANAGWPYPGSMTHKSPDRGFDDPIAVKCSISGKLRVRHIPEGESTGQAGCGDVKKIYAAIGQEITCTSPVPFVDDWTIRGNGLWRTFRSNPYVCVNGLTS